MTRKIYFESLEMFREEAEVLGQIETNACTEFHCASGSITGKLWKEEEREIYRTNNDPACCHTVKGQTISLQ